MGKGGERGAPGVSSTEHSEVRAVQLTEGTLYVGTAHDATAEAPGNGGLRVARYANEDAARDEAHALTEAMSRKHGAYNTGFRGAKLVVNTKVCPTTVDKEQLMQEVARELANSRGRVYTGCDMNTTPEDMEYLDRISPFVLSGIGSSVDPNKATSDGTLAAVVEAARHIGLPADFRVLVQGCGNVGGRLAERLAKMGATVITADVSEERAQVPGCLNAHTLLREAGSTDLFSLDVDIFSPNAVAGVITEEVVQRLKAKAIVGAANVPFRSHAARKAAKARGIVFVPEYITSAGAIIVDSLEWCLKDKPALWRDAEPEMVYAFSYDVVAERTRQHLSDNYSKGDAKAANEAGALEQVSSASDDESVDAWATAVGHKYGPWLNDRSTEVDVLVIGAGMAGTGTAYQLSKERPELKGLVLEGGPEVAPKTGSSYGDSRMFRRMYSDPYFSKMQATAIDMWRDLEKESGVQLLDGNGLLFYGEADTGETVEGSIPGCIEVMKQQGIPHQVLPDHAALAAKYPDMAAKMEHMGVFEPTAGSVRSSEACRQMMRLAQKNADWGLRTGARVTHIRKNEATGLYEVVVTQEGEDNGKLTTVRARKVVLCCGAWTNSLTKQLGCELDLEVWKVQWGHYNLRPDMQGKSEQWFHFGKDDALFYGIPVPGSSDVGKVGVDFSPADQRMPGEAPWPWRTEDDKAEVTNSMDDFIAKNWGHAYSDRVDMVVSPYTVTKDAMFVLDTLPNHPDVTLFTAGNGRAFKFAPLLGQALAAKVAGDFAPAFDTSRMSVTRPGMLKNVKGGYDQGPASGEAVDGAEGDASNIKGESTFGRAHVPYGEVGQAFYSKLTLGCFDVCWNSQDLISEAIRGQGSIGASYRMADFGAADGGPEMPLVHAIKDMLPPSTELEVCFEDQPNNDFKSMFYLATGVEKLPRTSRGECPPLTDREGIFFTGCGRTFFDQCLPTATVDLVTSFTAMHWLSKVPCALPDAVHHSTTKDEAGKRAFAEQAEGDWRTILGHRAKELKKGGMMMIATLATDPQGRTLGYNMEAGFPAMFAEFNRHWKAMADEGMITQAEYVNATIPNYYRNEAELRKPFEDGSLGLKLHKIEWRQTLCPFGRGLGSPAEVVGTMRTWSNSSFYSGLATTRPEAERKALVDEMYNRYIATVAADPAHFQMDYTHAYILAEKL